MSVAMVGRFIRNLSLVVVGLYVRELLVKCCHVGGSMGSRIWPDCRKGGTRGDFPVT